ncbi:MAG: hypothetical protein B7Y02_05170, partial [Rhodobacterales bacterium 17-64-5]
MRRTDVVELWHTHRTPLILCALFVLLAIRVYIHVCDYEQDVVRIPRLYDEKAPPAALAPTRSVAEKPVAKPTGPRRIKGGVVKKPSQEKHDAVDLTRPVKIMA